MRHITLRASRDIAKACERLKRTVNASLLLTNPV